jgi:hypothetical protein
VRSRIEAKECVVAAVYAEKERRESVASWFQVSGSGKKMRWVNALVPYITL